jgi:hypothetical protein
MLLTEPCVMIREVRDYKRSDVGGGGNGERNPWKCEVQGADVDSFGLSIVDIEGLDAEDVLGDQVISGVTTLRARGAEFANGRLNIPSGSQTVFGRAAPRGPVNNNGNGNKVFSNNGTGHRGLAITSGGVTKTVLVIRVKGGGASTTSNMATLSDNIFGTSGDSINLKSRYNECSYGDLKMEPFVGTTSKGVVIPAGSRAGVVEVSISNTVSGRSDDTIREAVTTAATKLLGNLPSQFDHVMLCLPPGTSGDW